MLVRTDSELLSCILIVFPRWLLIHYPILAHHSSYPARMHQQPIDNADTDMFVSLYHWVVLSLAVHLTPLDSFC